MATNSQWEMDLSYPLTGVNYIWDVEHAPSVRYLQLSSSVCDVVCDAGASSLWSLDPTGTQNIRLIPTPAASCCLSNDRFGQPY